MTQNRDLASGQPVRESWFDNLQEFISTLASGNFYITQVSDTAIRILSGDSDDQVALGIDGRWRYNNNTNTPAGYIEATVPGTPAQGTYAIYATAADNSFGGSPEVDSTNYSFAMEIKTSGTPSAALYRKIGNVYWSGSKIVYVEPLVGPRDTNYPGTIIESASPYAPPGYIPADGTSYARTTYPRLFAAIGTTYGSADGTHFNVPDKQGRVTVSRGTHTEVNTLGANDGLATSSRKIKHKHSKGTINTTAGGSHIHTVNDPGHFHGLGQVWSSDGAAFGVAASPAFYTFTFRPITDPATTGISIAPNTHAHVNGEFAGEIGDTTGPSESAAFIVLNHYVRV